MKVMFSSKSNEWSTPKWLFDSLNNLFNFTLDPCATHDNAKCEKYFTIKDNGLNKSWANEVVFCNPPYGREIKHWVGKSFLESEYNNSVVVMLIPARTDTKYWHQYIFNKADIYFLEGRLKFGNAKNSAPFPSAIVVFDKNKKDKVVKTISKNTLNEWKKELIK